MYFAKNASAPRKGWVKITLVLLGLALTVGGLVAFRGVSAKKEEKKADAVKVYEFAAGDIAQLKPVQLGQVIPISGTVRPVLQATVKSKVPAEVAKVHVQEGERVQAGQVLVSLDTADLKARLDTQLAAQAEAKAKLELARKNQENNKALLAKNFISQNAFDNVLNSVEVARANHQSAEAQAAIAQRALNDASIRAPFAGIVAKRWVNTGDKVTSDSSVAALVDLSRMELEAQIPVSDIPYVSVGHEISFKVDGFNGRQFKGKVERINPAAEAGSRSIAIFVTLPNPDAALKGGMFVNGTLAAADRGAVNAIPLLALTEEGGQAFVYALKDGTVERKPVTIGKKSIEQGLVEIREGLAVGTDVISVKQEGMKHGSKAMVKAPGAKPPAATQPAQAPETQNKKTS